MSQYIMKINDTTEAQIGWDPPLKTYYGRIYQLDKHSEPVDVIIDDATGEEKSGNLLWVGTSLREISDIDMLEAELYSYLQLSPELERELIADKDANR